MDIAHLRVMIVDDQQDARSMMRMMLSEMGINQIFESPDGREALSFMDVAHEMVDVIVCDWNMPRMTGIELLQQLRSVYPDMAFLMVTGRGDMDSVLQAKLAGVTAYIRKPFSLKQLEAKLRIINHRMFKENGKISKEAG